MTTSPDQCAQAVLEVTPIVIRVIRTQMRQNRAPALTVPQFRALVFVQDNDGSSLSQVAEYVGLTLPSTSTLVNGLVKRRLVTRQTHATDRRRMTLSLTTQGRQMLVAARQCTQTYLAEQLAQVPEAERTTINKAMALLNQIFTQVSPE
jgi:DNA-binding MarR family transcriptional regulator